MVTRVSLVRNWLIYCFLILFAAGLLSARTVSGIVLDGQTGEPVLYASVAVVDAAADSITTGGLTDKSGRFSITDIPQGQYVIEIQFIGYKQYRSSLLTIGQIPQNLGEILLEQDVLQLDAVAVEADAPAVRAEVNKTTYDADQLYSASGGTCCDIMESIPSVDVATDGQVSLRGSPDVAILLNGKRAGILGGDRRTNIMSVPVPADLVEKVEVITSPSASQDADGMVGIINIVLKDNNAPGFNGHFNINAGTSDKYNGSAYFNYRKETINHFLNLSIEDLNSTGTSYRRSEILQSGGEILEQSLREVTTDKRNLTSVISAGTRFQHSENTFIKGEVKYLPFERNRDMTINMENQETFISKQEDGALQLLDLGFRSESDRKYALSGNVSIESQNRENSSLGWLNSTPMDLFLEGSTNMKRSILELDYDYYLTPSFKLGIGAKNRHSVQDQPRTVTYQNSGSDYSAGFNFEERIRAAYFNLEYTTFMEDLSYSAGVRLEDAYTSGEAQFDTELFNQPGFPEEQVFPLAVSENIYRKMYPSFLISYTPSPLTRIQAGYSSRVNRITADFMDPLPRNLYDNSIVHTGSMTLKPEFIRAVELKVNRTLPTWSWEAVVFGQAIENVVREDDDLIDGTSVITWKNIGKGSNVGLEGRIRFKPFTFWEVTLNGLYFHTETNQSQETDLAGTLSGFQGKLTQVFTLAGGGKVEVESRLRGPENSPAGTVHPDGLVNLNLSLQQNLWDDRLELSVKLLDVFDNEELRSRTTESVWYSQQNMTGTHNLVSYDKPDVRSLFLTLRYKFGSGGKDRKEDQQIRSGAYRY